MSTPGSPPLRSIFRVTPLGPGAVPPCLSSVVFISSSVTGTSRPSYTVGSIQSCGVKASVNDSAPSRTSGVTGHHPGPYPRSIIAIRSSAVDACTPFSSLSGTAPPRPRGSLNTPLRNYPVLFKNDARRFVCHRFFPLLCAARHIRFISSLISFLMVVSSLPAFAFRAPAGVQ